MLFFFWVFSVSLLSAILSKVANFFVRFFFVLFSKIQCSTIFNCFSFTSTRISKKTAPSSWPKSLARFSRVCKCYIVELIESYVFLLSNIWNLPFPLACNLNATFIQICVFLFAINPCFSINTNNHKIKTFFAWKNKHFYNKGKNRGEPYLSINLQMQSCVSVCFYCFTEFVLVVFFTFISLNTIFTLRRSSWLVCFFLVCLLYSLYWYRVISLNIFIYI